jgi:hypothetical protein
MRAAWLQGALASMPPAILSQVQTPCSHSQSTTFKLRTPWWQKTIDVVSSALASNCCKLAGMFRLGINVAPSVLVLANSSGSRTSIRTSGSPASMRRWMSCGLVSRGRIVPLTSLTMTHGLGCAPNFAVRYEGRHGSP